MLLLLKLPVVPDAVHSIAAVPRADTAGHLSSDAGIYIYTGGTHLECKVAFADCCPCLVLSNALGGQVDAARLEVRVRVILCLR